MRALATVCSVRMPVPVPAGKRIPRGAQTQRKRDMKDIKVLGSGCANCKRTYSLIEETARAKGEAIALEKVEDMASIMGYGIMSTPGVVIDGRVVHAGGVPDRRAVESWFA